MNISLLDPPPRLRENFRLDRQKFIPEKAGCYVLVSFQGVVLYVGLTNNFRRRFSEHLNDPKKCSPTKYGRAIYFCWVECSELEKVERTWQNKCLIEDGELPVLNGASSPISI